jgi:hypothetical protein
MRKKSLLTGLSTLTLLTFSFKFIFGNTASQSIHHSPKPAAPTHEHAYSLTLNHSNRAPQ